MVLAQRNKETWFTLSISASFWVCALSTERPSLLRKLLLHIKSQSFYTGSLSLEKRGSLRALHQRTTSRGHLELQTPLIHLHTLPSTPTFETQMYSFCKSYSGIISDLIWSRRESKSWLITPYSRGESHFHPPSPPLSRECIQLFGHYLLLWLSTQNYELFWCPQALTQVCHRIGTQKQMDVWWGEWMI